MNQEEEDIGIGIGKLLSGNLKMSEKWRGTITLKRSISTCALK
jgi:hypothetical protein